MFHFTCFNPEDPHDPSVGLINGQLCIPGKLLREMVFDPVVSQVNFHQHTLLVCPYSTIGSCFDRGTNAKDKSANSGTFPCGRCWQRVPGTMHQGMPTVTFWEHTEQSLGSFLV